MVEGFCTSDPKGPDMNALTRPTHDRMIAGVCSGIARRFGLSANVVRVAFVLSMLLPGPQLVIYLVAWLLMPSDPNA